MPRPKIIHYCWFGPNPIPEIEKKCIESWKEKLPDWDLLLWNEQTFDLNKSLFCRQAYDAGQYAFVSDYVRASVLHEFGGLYLDTDVEILSGFAKLLEQNINFVGFETKFQVGTAVMAFAPQHKIIKKILKCYDTSFVEKNNMNITANVVYLTNILSENGLLLNRKKQEVGDITVFERECFFPKKIAENTFDINDLTVAIHRCSGSWMTERQKKRGNNKIWVRSIRPCLRFFQKLLIILTGEKLTQKLEIKIRNFLR